MSHGDGRQPDFVIIGGMKCGTTSLYNYLGLHPSVGLSAKKELEFFIEHRGWQRGLAWYRSQFAHVSDVAAVGECSPNYTARHYFPGVAERMASVLPDAKIIYVVRDPIDRIVSQYVHQVAAGRERQPFDDAVKLDDPDSSQYILTSRYHWQLSPYLQCFPEDHLLIVPFEDLVRATVSTVQHVFEFLGVDSAFRHADFERVHNPSNTKRRLTSLGRRLGQPGRALVGRVVPPVVWKRVTAPDVTPETRARLTDLLKEDCEALRRLTGFGFEAWSV